VASVKDSFNLLDGANGVLSSRGLRVTPYGSSGDSLMVLDFMCSMRRAQIYNEDARK
jgi:hypothetical protein